MELIDHILRQNPWWQGREIAGLAGLQPRNLYYEILGTLEKKQIISLVGLRRVGKTTLLYHIITNLLKQGIEAKAILYFSFDELLGKEPEIIERIIEIYHNEILRKEAKKVYIFFDEINHVKDWQVILKRHYDLGGTKFFVSGSSGVFIKKSKESLAGRIYEFELLPLSFKEYLSLKKIPFHDQSINRLVLKKELQYYLFSGAFPEIVTETDNGKVNRYVRSIIEKIIFYDIPQVYSVSEPAVLFQIFESIARAPGNLVEYTTLASTFKITYQTVSKYVDYLEHAFLVRLLYNYRGSLLARTRKAKKVYLTTPALAAAFVSEEEFRSLLPHLVENMVVTQLGARFFWREYYELDIIHNNLPIEVKYQEEPEITGALEGAKKLKSKELLVITKDTEKKVEMKGLKITFIPLWKWLLKS
jgi:predicted AAA+ superfamily ATPase